MSEKIFIDKISRLTDHLSKEVIASFFKEGKQCESRDVFQAQLEVLYQTLKNPLLIAVCGEIGNNSFDHNLGNWRDLSGVYFEVADKDKIIVLADRGQGVRKTLSNVVSGLVSDLEAVKTAFVKTISGRNPEQRGNGLKFVASAFKKNPWELYFQSGHGTVRIAKGGITFGEAQNDVKGCLAVIRY